MPKYSSRAAKASSISSCRVSSEWLPKTCSISYSNFSSLVSENISEHTPAMLPKSWQRRGCNPVLSTYCCWCTERLWKSECCKIRDGPIDWYVCNEICGFNWGSYRRDFVIGPMIKKAPQDRFEFLDEFENSQLPLSYSSNSTISEVIDKWRQIPSRNKLPPRRSRTRR